MSRARGNDGDELILTGQNFGPAPGSVMFKERGGSGSAGGNLIDWSASRIRLQVKGYQRSTTADSPADVVVVRADSVASPPRSFTLGPAAALTCYAYRTKGTNRYQIACQPDVVTCRAKRNEYLTQNRNVEGTDCAVPGWPSCYWIGSDANNCFSSTTECESHRNSDFVLGAKSAYCYEQKIAGPASRY